MKRNSGIILIVIAALNIIAWIPDFAKGKVESWEYYVFIFMILGGGIYLLGKSKAKNQK